MKIKKSTVVLYHNDPDGFGAAWAAWKKLGDKADYMSVDYRADLPKGLKNKKLFFVDFCPSEQEIKKLTRHNKEVIVIDHHISQKEIVENIEGSIFDNDHSGAVLAWKYFHSKKRTPKLLQHIEDMDIWKWKLSRSRELMASLDTYKFDFKLWSKIASDWEDAKKRKKYIDEGGAILKYQNKIIEKLAKNGEKVKINGIKAIAVNSPILASQIGHVVSKKGAVGIVWAQKDSKIKISLRSNGKTDVSKMAAKFGGGGHKAASAFVLDTKINFPWKKRK